MQWDELERVRRARDEGASSSRGGGSPGRLARALEVAEEHLQQALVDGQAQVYFNLVSYLILNYYIFIFLIFSFLFCSE